LNASPVGSTPTWRSSRAHSAERGAKGFDTRLDGEVSASAVAGLSVDRGRSVRGGLSPAKRDIVGDLAAAYV
jgi:hypothetical protein